MRPKCLELPVRELRFYPFFHGRIERVLKVHEELKIASDQQTHGGNFFFVVPLLGNPPLPPDTASDATAPASSDASRQILPLAIRQQTPVELSVLRASYNGQHLSFPSPGALIRVTVYAHSHVIISPSSTKNHCSCALRCDASFHPAPTARS